MAKSFPMDDSQKQKTVATTTTTTTPSERRHIEGPDPDAVSLESRSGPALSLSLSLFARVGWPDVGTDVLPMLTQQVQLVATTRWIWRAKKEQVGGSFLDADLDLIRTGTSIVWGLVPGLTRWWQVSRMTCRVLAIVSWKPVTAHGISLRHLDSGCGWRGLTCQDLESSLSIPCKNPGSVAWGGVGTDVSGF